LGKKFYGGDLAGKRESRRGKIGSSIDPCRGYVIGDMWNRKRNGSKILECLQATDDSGSVQTGGNRPDQNPSKSPSCQKSAKESLHSGEEDEKGRLY